MQRQRSSVKAWSRSRFDACVIAPPGHLGRTEESAIAHLCINLVLAQLSRSDRCTVHLHPAVLVAAPRLYSVRHFFPSSSPHHHVDHIDVAMPIT